MTRRIAALALLAAACHGAMPAPVASSAGFSERTIVFEGVPYRYRIFVPPGYATAPVHPVVLFLHGMGERGSDNERPAHYSLGAYLRAHGDSFPAVVVFPQVPADSYWTGAPARMALAALERTIAEVGGDRHRLYLTGLSMGGYGSWEMALARPRLFAAAAIICGGIVAPGWDSMLRVRSVPRDVADPYAYVARRTSSLPIWLFHGDADNTVPVTESRRMADALRQAGGTVKYTEYAGAGHNTWDRAYADPALWRWLFAIRRR